MAELLYYAAAGFGGWLVGFRVSLGDAFGGPQNPNGGGPMTATQSLEYYGMPLVLIGYPLYRTNFAAGVCAAAVGGYIFGDWNRL